jgi:hypothetical protein
MWTAVDKGAFVLTEAQEIGATNEHESWIFRFGGALECLCGESFIRTAGFRRLRLAGLHLSEKIGRGTVCVLTALTLFASHGGAQSKAACDRACLTGFVDSYFKALLAHDAGALPQAARARITENGSETGLAKMFWAGAAETVFRFDVVNTRRGDTGTEAIIRNADGTKTMYMVRLKVQNGAITEIETIKANKGEADRLWDPDRVKEVSPAFKLSIREAERDSYFDLIAAADSYWRAFQTNGTPAYHRARLLPDAVRFENGLQTTGLVRDGVFNDTARGFDEGRFIGRNIWDRRYAVVDEERGVVLAIVRFGLKGGAKSQSIATSNDRLVAEFFAIKNGSIQEIQAVLFNLPDAKATGWPADYGPGVGATE